MSHEYDALARGRQRLEDAISSIGEKCNTIIVDEKTDGLFDLLFKQKKLSKLGILHIENLESKRCKLLDCSVIYFISDTQKSISILSEDFGEDAKYMSGHVFVSGILAKGQLVRISRLKNRRRIRTLKELFLDINIMESRVITFDMQDAFYKLHFPSEGSNDENNSDIIDEMAKKMLYLCSLFNWPNIRYLKSDSLSLKLADATWAEFQKCAEKIKNAERNRVMSGEEDEVRNSGGDSNNEKSINKDNVSKDKNKKKSSSKSKRAKHSIMKLFRRKKKNGNERDQNKGDSHELKRLGTRSGSIISSNSLSTLNARKSGSNMNSSTRASGNATNDQTASEDSSESSKNSSSLENSTAAANEGNRDDWTNMKISENVDLVIIDRSSDLITPLVHDLSYRSCVYDLLFFVDGECTFALSEESMETRKLNYKDRIWNKVENEHLEVAQRIITDEKERARKNILELRKREDEMKANNDVYGLTQLAHEIPLRREEIALSQMHVEMLIRILDVYKTHQLDKVIELEQDLATGLSKKLKKFAAKNFFSRVSALLSDQELCREDRLRVLFLYLHHVGLEELKGTLSKLKEFCELELEIGECYYKLLRASGRKKQVRPPKNDREFYYELSRYLPYVHDISLLDNKLDEEFPSVIDEDLNKNKAQGRGDFVVRDQESKSKRVPSKWFESSFTNISMVDIDMAQKKLAMRKKTLVIFVIGGITGAEIVSVYRNCNMNRDLYIAGTHVEAATTFLDYLGSVM